MSGDDSTYRRVARQFGDTLARVRDEQWTLPTPCEEWDVATLAGHVIDTHKRVYAMIDDTGISNLDENAPLIEQWRIVATTYASVIDDERLAATPVKTRRGDQTFADLVEGLVMTDTLCHSWDLARATGANEELDPLGVASAHEMLVTLGDSIRVVGGFGEAIEPTDGADQQTRLLNFSGRVV
jgi:uncharacterized protein (TIGR03086 family)